MNRKGGLRRKTRLTILKGMEKRKSASKNARKSNAGRPPLSEDAKRAKQLKFGVRGTHYQEFLDLKEKWGIRDLAEAARKIWLAGLDSLKREEGPDSSDPKP